MAQLPTARYHGEPAADAARERFDTLHVRRELPDEIDEFGFSAENGQVHLPALMADAFGLSRSEARRLLSQGGVKLDGKELDALDLPADDLDGAVLQVGRRRFKKLRRARLTLGTPLRSAIFLGRASARVESPPLRAPRSLKTQQYVRSRRALRRDGRVQV